MRARPPWTGWSRSRSAGSPSPPPPPPASGSGTAPSTGSTSSIRRATWTSPSRWSARSACSTAPSPCSTRWPASSRRPRRSGARPTGTACRGSSSPTRWTGSAPTSIAASSMIRDRLTKKAYPIQLPVGSGELFTGHIDVLRRVEIIFDDETLGKTFTEMPVPEAYRERVEAARHEVIEAAVEHDDELLEKYLGGAELSFDEISSAIRKATTAGSDRAGALRRLLQEQGRAGAARRGHRLPAEPGRTSPPIKGHLPLHDDTLVERAPRTTSRSRALAFKIATDPYVGRLTFFRVYSGSLKSGQLRLQQHQGQAGADRAAAPDARQQAGRDRGSARRRHRARPSVSRTPAPATRCPTRTSRSSSRR